MEGSHMCKTQYLQVGDYFTFGFCFDLIRANVVIFWFVVSLLDMWLVK